MKYSEYILGSKNTEVKNRLRKFKLFGISAKSDKIQYDRIQISRDEISEYPKCITLIKDSVPYSVINGINGKNKQEVILLLKEYKKLKEITKKEFENNRFVASKIMALGADVISEPEFIKRKPEPKSIENENKELIAEIDINNPGTIETYINETHYIEIGDEIKFKELLTEEKAVLYNRIDWSGVDRISRIKIAKALRKIDSQLLPRYIVNNSDQGYKFYNDYIRKSNTEMGRLTTYGSGEIFLFKKGRIVDYISRGFLINNIEIDLILKKWTTDNK